MAVLILHSFNDDVHDEEDKVLPCGAALCTGDVEYPLLLLSDRNSAPDSNTLLSVVLEFEFFLQVLKAS